MLRIRFFNAWVGKLSCCLSILLLLAGISYGMRKDPLAKNGILDLRKESFSDGIKLNGEWKFYWKQLSDPSKPAFAGGVIVDFPFKWQGFMLNGKELPSYGYASYILKVLVPKDKGPLRINMPEVYSAYRLYINGTELASNGRVSTSEKGFVPYWEHQFVDLPKDSDTLNITLQIANFAHSQGGISKPLVLGKKMDLRLDRQRTMAIDLLLTGCLFMGGLFFLGLYLFGNRDRAILLFSMYSIVYSYRIIGINNYVLHTILPDMNWYVTTRLEYLTLFAGIGIFSMYTRYLYPLDVNVKIVNIICQICIIFFIISLIVPPFYYSQLVNPFLVVMAFSLLYIPYIYIKAQTRKRPGAGYALASGVVLMSIFAISLFSYWGLIPQLQLFSFVAYIAFFFLQSLILSYRVSFVLKKAREEAELGLVAKSEFLSTMSHEIRTPLNAVIGMSHLLLKNDPRPDQVEQLDVMLFSANNLLSIVNDILDYNKIEAGKITFEYIEMDVASIMRNIVKGLHSAAQDKGIDLKLQVDDSLQNKLMGDPTRIFQVMTNLVHNAIKFTQKGYVEVELKVLEQTEQSVTLKMQVKDTGIGISKEKQKLIFERFTQADSSTSRGFGGTGLGLAISKKILELQDSALELESQEGRGSAFFFVQTFEKSIKTIEQQNIEKNLPKPEDKPFTGINILLVEDNPMNVLVAQTFLQRWGAIIDVATNGLEATRKFDQNKHKLILMDLHMPVMDGYEATRRLRADGATLPIIALTANLPKEIEEQVRDTGIDDIVVKPFLPDELFRKVLHYIQ